ncbi:MAG: biotin--[acetyl-CoA-carboxylase] ligase [Candidatus Eremiobacteraeota bacterium]|nr:biotin--[acetyl-CoA-carboxylase] ligase [Candidatus Eremiobacteraeota bacterium]
MTPLEAGPYESVARQLAGRAFGSISYVEETDSTNANAAALLDDPRYGGHTIVAEYQRRGAGRRGRVWMAPAGTALLCTTILPRSFDSEKLWVVPFWVALAVRAALLDFSVTTTLQWPNDLLLADRKLAGVLCRSAVTGAAARVACGVGVNVYRPVTGAGIEPPPAFCDDVAAVPRNALLHAVLLQYDRSLSLLDQPDRIAIAWNDAAEVPGKRYRIALDDAQHPFDVVAQGLENGGGLRVVRDGGIAQTISLADARVLR